MRWKCQGRAERNFEALKYVWRILGNVFESFQHWVLGSHLSLKWYKWIFSEMLCADMQDRSSWGRGYPKDGSQRDPVLVCREFAWGRSFYSCVQASLLSPQLLNWNFFNDTSSLVVTDPREDGMEEKCGKFQAGKVWNLLSQEIPMCSNEQNQSVLVYLSTSDKVTKQSWI